MDKTRRRQVTIDSGEESKTGAGVAVIGIGAVGSSLVRSLHRTNYRLLALINRTSEIATAVAGEAGVPLVSDSVVHIPDEARLIFICTREETIPEVVERLLETDYDFRDAVVAHVSGRLSAAILNPLSSKGARTLSFHPLGAFPPGPSDKRFQGLTIGLEGDALAVAVGAEVARDLGAIPVEIPTGSKTAYHLAASLTSNYLVTLMDDVRRVLAAAELPADLTLSLAADTLRNLVTSPPSEALTGPIARADAEALEAQVASVRGIAPELLPRFLSLAEGTIDLALSGGRISPNEGARLRQILDESVPD